MRTETKARLDLTGITPLVLNNAELADPDSYYATEIKKITDKRNKMTPEEREQKEALQWRGSLYLGEDDALVLPAPNLLASLTEAARTFKKGQLIERGGVMVTETEAPIQYDGPTDLKALYEDHRFRFRTVVNGNPTRGRNGGKVVSMRPQFPTWTVSYTVVVFADILGWDDFLRIADAAGATGVGNARKLGRGRFSARVVKL